MNAAKIIELSLTGAAAVVGIMIWWYRYRLASYVLAEDSTEVSGWKKGVPVFFLLTGQLILIWSLIYGLHQFGITAEPAQP